MCIVCESMRMERKYLKIAHDETTKNHIFYTQIKKHKKFKKFYNNQWSLPLANGAVTENIDVIFCDC